MIKSMQIILIVITLISVNVYGQDFEMENNFLHNISFLTGTNRGRTQNLEDNFTWMNQQGYTHLRFFGIYPNHYHIFPSPTLDANGYPSNENLETLLGQLVQKANEHGITVNFDGWEVIAEANRDTLGHGVSYITEEELASVINDVLALGVDLITEEQFEMSYLQVIQETTSYARATHETTAGLWWDGARLADQELASVFSFFPYNQHECDSINGLGSSVPANLGIIHAWAEGAHYFGYPFTLAVGSFGTLEPENWKNVMLFAQIQHNPERFSVEEQDRDFTIWDNTFNFMDDVGDEIINYESRLFSERPVVNLVVDAGSIYSVFPSYYALLVDLPAIVNTFTMAGYRVISTVGSCLPEAEAYYVLLTGGANESQVAPLPAYVLPLLDDDRPVFFQTAYGIPDENDSQSWIPLRNHFGLPSGNTESIAGHLPESVFFNGQNALWGGIELYLQSIIERLSTPSIDTAVASVILDEEVLGSRTALIIQNGPHYLINSNMLHLEASYVFSRLFSQGPLNSPATADIAVNDDQAIIYAEYDTDIDLELSWTGLTEVIRYNPAGDMVYSGEDDLNQNYVSSLSRGELVLLKSVALSGSDDESGLFRDRSAYFCRSQPNPFNMTTKIDFENTAPGHVKMEIYNLLGQLEAVLIDSYMSAGVHSIIWRADDLPSGVYFCRLKVDEFESNIKLILMK